MTIGIKITRNLWLVEFEYFLVKLVQYGFWQIDIHLAIVPQRCVND